MSKTKEAIMNGTWETVQPKRCSKCNREFSWEDYGSNAVFELRKQCPDCYYEMNAPTDEEQQEAYDYFEAAKTLPTIAEKKELVKQSIKDQIMSGYLNPLEFYRQCKIAIDTLEELKKDPDVLDCVQTEIAKYGKEKPTINGAVVTMVTRDTPDLDSCGDPVYDELKRKLEERKKYLKGIPKEGSVDPETGVLIQQPVINSTTYIQVKL